MQTKNVKARFAKLKLKYSKLLYFEKVLKNECISISYEYPFLAVYQTNKLKYVVTHFLAKECYLNKKLSKSIIIQRQKVCVFEKEIG